MRSVKRRDLWALFGLSLAVRLAVAAFITRPGYMDVAYYAAGAVHLGRGGGLSEPFLWNYLHDPAGLPSPGFLYWMPLPSLLAAPFAALFPGSFFALQLPFTLISALLPLLTYGVAWETTRQRRAAWVAGLLTLFSGFFVSYWSLPETFAPFALFGSLALWLAGRGIRGTAGKGQSVGLLVGVLVGLAHLTRVDGVLLLPVVALAPLSAFQSRGERCTFRDVMRRETRSLVMRWSLIGLGYLLVMGPWFARNLSLIGAPLSPAGTRTLWLTDYDDLYCYGCDLSPRSYLAWGWDNILRSKLFGLWINFQHLLAEDCQVFLLPFAVIGLYRLRKRSVFVQSFVYLCLLYLTHSLAFTFPGWRGGFFHSSGVLLPFLHTAATDGLDAAVSWAGRRRRWNLRQARTVFAVAIVMAAVALSVYAALHKLPTWWGVDEVYRELGAWLDARNGPADTIVMVDNPPGFYYHTGVRSVVVPNGDVDTLLDVCERYRVGYVVLDFNRPVSLDGLYQGRVVSPRLVPVATFEEGRVVVWSVQRAVY
jgi:4-amino-4-deoxy-L-arabinose transferase-like glycosyltransferase